MFAAWSDADLKKTPDPFPQILLESVFANEFNDRR